MSYSRFYRQNPNYCRIKVQATISTVLDTKSRPSSTTSSRLQDGFVVVIIIVDAHYNAHLISTVRYAAAALATNPEKSLSRYLGVSPNPDLTFDLIQPPLLGASTSARTSRT
jgi:hypothetical protein